MKWIETMHCRDGQVMLLEYHLDRLCWGFYQNQVTNVSSIREICKKKILEYTTSLLGEYRVRMLFDLQKLEFEFSSTLFAKQCRVWNIGIYPDEQKSVSIPWNAKTTERAIYDRATIWAKENQLDDAIILNERGRVVDTTIFNVFILKEGVLYTAPLSDMPVKGVMRSWMMSNCIYPIIEKSLTMDDLDNADQILLTNALRGLQLAELIK